MSPGSRVQRALAGGEQSSPLEQISGHIEHVMGILASDAVKLHGELGGVSLDKLSALAEQIRDAVAKRERIDAMLAALKVCCLSLSFLSSFLPFCFIDFFQ